MKRLGIVWGVIALGVAMAMTSTASAAPLSDSALGTDAAMPAKPPTAAPTPLKATPAAMPGVKKSEVDPGYMKRMIATTGAWPPNHGGGSGGIHRGVTN